METNLVTLTKAGHLYSHRTRNLAAHICINLIKDHERRAVLVSERIFHGKHDTGNFATGCYLPEGLEWLSRVGTK